MSISVLPRSGLLEHDVVSVLPDSTEIKFVGFWGRQWEKELIKTNRLPKGGQGLT